MINNLDMNICTEAPRNNRCMACKKINEINHHIVAENSIITLCTKCLEKLCIRGIERCGYRKKKGKVIIKKKGEKLYGKKI